MNVLHFERQGPEPEIVKRLGGEAILRIVANSYETSIEFPPHTVIELLKAPMPCGHPHACAVVQDNKLSCQACTTAIEFVQTGLAEIKKNVPTSIPETFNQSAAICLMLRDKARHPEARKALTEATAQIRNRAKALES